jgi:hypothetical protein
MTDHSPITKWKSVYERYVQLERNWSVPGAPEPVARQFFRRIVHGHQNDAAILREFRSFQLDPPASDLLGEAFFLQGALYPPDHKLVAGILPKLSLKAGRIKRDDRTTLTL